MDEDIIMGATGPRGLRGPRGIPGSKGEDGGESKYWTPKFQNISGTFGKLVSSSGHSIKTKNIVFVTVKIILESIGKEDGSSVFKGLINLPYPPRNKFQNKSQAMGVVTLTALEGEGPSLTTNGILMSQVNTQYICFEFHSNAPIYRRGLRQHEISAWFSYQV